MPYRFKPRESVSKGFRRIIVRQLELAQRALAGKDKDVGVHEARKSIKRIRALLRLARPGLAKRRFDAENTRFRDIARMLSTARDRRVMRDTLAALEQTASPTRKKALIEVRAHLDSLGNAPGQRANDAVVAAAIDGLAKAERELREADVPIKAVSDLISGLQDDYRKARRLRHAAFHSDDEEDLHDLRKLVQVHWRHMLLLSSAWPDMAAARVALAREVSQQLGEDHDLAVLQAYAREHESDLGQRVARQVMEMCEASQLALRKAAEPRADLLFIEPAKDFADRLQDYWGAAKAISAAKSGRDIRGPKVRSGTRSPAHAGQPPAKRVRAGRAAKPSKR